MTQTPQPGWYDDATNAAAYRWWDGTRWTEATHPREGPAKAATPQDPRPRTPAAQPRPALGPRRAGPKVSFFGARARAEELLVENDELRGTLEAFGGMSPGDAERLLAGARADAERERAEARKEVDRLRDEAATLRAELSRLAAELIEPRHAVTIQELGLYDFEHPAEESASLANELSALRVEIKQMVSTGAATVASESVTFGNSAAKGRRFVKDMSKTMLSAYNAEAENCIKSVKAGGLTTARARLERVAERVARNGAMIDLHIAPRFHKLRLDELTLAARHLEAVKAARDAERERRADLREQNRAEEELRRERERLQKERDHYANALEALRARGDTAGAESLEAKLADVDKALDDVDYRAANIRAGYVYVISNVGAFGERMVKIGMTRRLDPMDRIRELGDASVPFRFDVHALFFSDDAVGVETMLHRELAEVRVNRMNPRREFFYVTPAEVLDALHEHNIAVVEFKTEPDAEEFRLSQAVAAQSS